MAVNKILIGSDFCTSDCADRNTVFHPQTNLKQVLIDEDSNLTLYDWFYSSSTQQYSTLQELLQSYSTTYTLPKATSNTLGGITIDDKYLTYNDEKQLTVNIGDLPIPKVTINNASFYNDGSIKLGHTKEISTLFSINTTIDDNNPYFYFPLRVDANNRAGIGIPKSYWNTNQSDWEEQDPTSSSYIKNKPVINSPDVNDSTITLKQGNTVIGQFSLNQDNDTEINIPSQTIEQSTYELPVATEGSLGGIQVGFSETSSKKPVQLDEGNNAYVEIKKPTAAFLTNGLSSHYFSVSAPATGDVPIGYVPIMKIAKAADYNGDFKINQLFRIISRHDCNFIGTFYINYKADGSDHYIIAQNIVSESKENVEFLTTNSIKVGKVSDTEAIVYLYIPYVGYNSKCTFIVDILGENDLAEENSKGVISFKPVNDITYYCTTSFNTTEEVITSSDIKTTVDDSFDFKYLP